ncbi:MAG TPA: 3-isopropylmalate dehydratase large subunit, partial [Vicinamibacterales bacterium]|nr:3-isopropylmalate dehydratase large subunit [Vicinamibacterales bacterium]
AVVAETLLQKVWDAHTVRLLPNGQTQLFIGLHLIHEVTTPQAFDMLRGRGWTVKYPARTLATVDHIVPTLDQRRPFADVMAEDMLSALERNCRWAGVRLLDLSSGAQGIVHVIGPELGLTQPGMTIACGDSHTSTHGAFGAVAFGIGTSQVRDVLASQCLAMDPLKVRRIRVNGQLRRGVFAKDVILEIIRRLGVNGGVGYAYEYAGDIVDRMTMDERMTICNMSIEGGARVGYVNPDQTTIDYLRGRTHAPENETFETASAWWKSMASDPGAAYDDDVEIDGSLIRPTVTWGINPGQSVYVDERLPKPGDAEPQSRASLEEALGFMGLRAGEPIAGTKIDVAFVGSCTNARLSDLREAARVIRGRHVAPHVKALVVPGSQAVRAAAEREGLDRVFIDAGFEWRGAGCSMCLAMNPDKLEGREICASSSNRNFKGRQGSPTGRTLLMSPAMVAAAAIAGEIVDVRAVADGN